MFKRFFKWIAEAISSEFPAIQDPPSTEIAVVEAVEVTKKPQNIEDYEKGLGFHHYKLKDLIELRSFITLLGSKELIGYKNNLVLDDNEELYSSFQFKHLLNVIIFTKDGFEFHFDAWNGYIMGTTHYMSYSAYEVITAAAQGHLFDDPTILREPEYRRVCGETLSYEKSGYMAQHEDQGQRKYLKQVAERTFAHIEKLIAELPIMERENNSVPVFNKLWEQMELPLDTGTELVKL